MKKYSPRGRAETQSLELITRKNGNAGAAASSETQSGDSEGIIVTYEVSQSIGRASQREQGAGTQIFEGRARGSIENVIHAL